VAATASGASLRLSVDGTDEQTQPLAALAAGESRIVAVVGPACTQWVEAAVDPDDAVVELSESDNTHSFACADFARR
jgi:subtilase family serine protease